MKESISSHRNPVAIRIFSVLAFFLLASSFQPVAGGQPVTPARATPQQSGPPGAADEEMVVLETSMGPMLFRLFAAEAPRTVANFKRLVAEGFYDGQPFYRVVAGHVIQAGDGGENDQPKVPGEFGAHPHVVGALGLARGPDPDSGNTEIYVCHAARPHLDGKYAVFGLLVEGFDVLDAIGKVPVTEQWDGEVAFHRPKTPVLIDKAHLLRRSISPSEP